MLDFFKVIQFFQSYLITLKTTAGK